MPRIDPIQLLNCLSVLLSPNGGIKSRDEVQRLANLMIKFSKKLVSKCIYVQILKSTETDLLGLFMGSDGWMLVHTWLTESIVIKNWPLVRELLELLLLCPVDIERLKTNNCPKLVKELSKDGNHFAIRALASKLVEQWLKIVKGERVVPVSLADLPHIISEAKVDDSLESTDKENDSEKLNVENFLESKLECEESFQSEVKDDVELFPKDKDGSDDKIKEEPQQETEGLLVLKISLKDGKQVVSKVDDNEKLSDGTSDTEKSKEKHKSKSKEKSSEKSSSSSSKSNSSKHSSRSHSSSDKHKSSHKSSSSSSRHSSKDKSKDRGSHSSKSKHDSSSKKSSDKSSSSGVKSKDERSLKNTSEKDKKEKENKDKNDKNKDKSSDKSDDKAPVPSIHKLGKIPKLSDVKREKPSISIEVRKPDEPKPKTVKTFHSKFRKHGLEEEVKPPPSRASLLNKKVPPVLPPTVAIPKRPSPVHNESPPEKKPKTTEIVEKPGAIKLIPPKAKRSPWCLLPLLVSSSFYNSIGFCVFSAIMLLESDMFMDALNASATNKKEPKKRKRRTSGSKDGSAPGDASPPRTPTALNSPNSENKSVPPRFYQDTLEAEESKDKSQDKTLDENEDLEDKVVDKETEEKIETPEPHTLTVNGLKGVLCYHKKKGPKKSIKWKPDSELEEIQYFELDETERVNVTKTFTDMKYLDRMHEREAFQKARNLSNDDVMEEKTNWKPLILVDVEGQLQVDYGKNSKEKDIQAIRQKGTLQPLYFHKSMIPDSPLEPEPETHQYSEPTIIPLEDATGNQDNISDFRNMPWPEPKGNAPPTTSNMSMPTMFPSNIPQFPNNFPNAQFPGVPGFQGPNMVPGEWQNGMAPQMMPNGMPVPMGPTTIAPNAIPPGSMPPGMMMPPDNMMIGPEMFGGPNQMFPGPPEAFNMQQNMFPIEFNMAGPQVPGPDAFSGPGNFRGPMRGRGAGGWRGKGPGNWDNTQRGRGGARGGRKTVCIYFQRKGSCRQGDNCTFLHPGVNCPY